MGAITCCYCRQWHRSNRMGCDLTHWGRATHICVSKLTIIGSDNGLSPERRQVIIWTNAGMLLIGPLGTNFSEILIKIQTFSLKKIRLKMSSAKCCSFRLGLSVLMECTGKVVIRCHNLFMAHQVASQMNVPSLVAVISFCNFITLNSFVNNGQHY